MPESINIKVERNQKTTADYLFVLIHYWFPVILGLSLAILVHYDEHLPYSPVGLTLFLSGIGAAYSLDRLWDHKGTIHTRWMDITILAVFIICTITGLIAAIQIPRITILAVVFFSLSSILYKWVKKYYLVKTLIVTAVWIWALMLLPVSGSSLFNWQWWTSGIAIPLSLEFISATILCDIKDLKSDRRYRVPSLPVTLGIKTTTLIAGAVALVAAGIAWKEGYDALCISSFCLAILSQFPSLLSRKNIGSLTVDATLALSGLLIVLNVVK